MELRKHLVISDTQVKPESRMEHLEWCGKYIVDKQPDVVVHLGDHWDMPSLFAYDEGASKVKRAFEQRSYAADVAAGVAGMQRLLQPLRAYQQWTVEAHKPRYTPELHFITGNHEDRVTRAIGAEPMLRETLSLEDFKLKELGWIVHPFLEVVVLDGVAYSHYFVSGQMGRPVTSARALLTKHHMSCVAGHQQGRDIAYSKRADGTLMTAIITGSFYLDDQDYLNPQTNQHWRGLYVLHEVQDGRFDEMAVSVDYLERAK